MSEEEEKVIVLFPTELLTEAEIAELKVEFRADIVDKLNKRNPPTGDNVVVAESVYD